MNGRFEGIGEYRAPKGWSATTVLSYCNLAVQKVWPFTQAVSATPGETHNNLVHWQVRYIRLPRILHPLRWEGRHWAWDCPKHRKK